MTAPPSTYISPRQTCDEQRTHERTPLHDEAFRIRSLTSMAIRDVAMMTFVFVSFACSKQTDPGEAPAPPPPPPPAPEEHVPPPASEPEPTPSDLGITILSGVGFATPESVVHDPAQDMYFVSNVSGVPTDKDDNGFISKVTPEGDVTAKFIDASSEEIELNAPKGLTVHDGILYVTDIDHVRWFDAETGQPKGSIKAPGASFLNAIKSAGDGSFIVSDTGLAPDFSSSGTAAIYRLKDGKLKKLVASPKLTGPNGVLPDGEGGAWVVTFGGKELYRVGRWGRLGDIQTLPAGSLDGIQKTEDGRFLVSSWEASAVFAGKPGEKFEKVITGVESPADIGYDAKRNRVLIPLFKKDTVILHTLTDPSTTAATPPTANDTVSAPRNPASE